MMDLTPSERNTVKELVFLAIEKEDCTNKGIAESMGKSAETVRTHLNRAMEKNGLSNRTQLAIYAYIELVK